MLTITKVNIAFSFAANYPIAKASLRYGKGKGEILLDNLMCNGDEESLLNGCEHADIFEHNCATDHSEDAGVICGGKL